MTEVEVRKSRKHGGSTVIPLTGFVELDKFYKLYREDNRVIIEEVQI